MVKNELTLYRFAKNNRVYVEIEAENLNAARIIFQQIHGYWPDKELTDDDLERNPSTQAESTED